MRDLVQKQNESTVLDIGRPASMLLHNPKALGGAVHHFLGDWQRQIKVDRI